MKTLPAAELIAVRLRCLYAAFLRGHAEVVAKKQDSGLTIPVAMSVPEQYSLCQASLNDPELSKHFTKTERELIARKLGSLKVFETRYCLYRSEGVNVLAWGLRGFNDNPDPARCIDIVMTAKLPPEGALGDALVPWLKRPKLRPADELEKRFLLEQAWAWRIRIEIMMLTIFIKTTESVPDPATAFVAEQVAARAALCEKQGLFKARRGDFPSGRSTYGKNCELDFAERGEKAADERLRAAAWMLRPTTPWDSASAASPVGFEMPAKFRGPRYSIFAKHHFNPPTGLDSYRFPR